MSRLTTCPVLLFAEKTATQAGDLVTALRTLQHLLHHCKSCHNARACERLAVYNAAIDDAVSTIAAEWNLT